MKKMIILLIVGLGLWHQICRAGFDKQYIGVNYSPYHGGAYGPDYPAHPKDWGSYTKAEIEADIKLIAKHFKSLRTYTVQYNQYYIVSLAAQYNLDVAQGAHLWEPVNDPAYPATHDYDQAKQWVWVNHTKPELDKVIQIAKAHPHTVKCIIVGNEWIGAKTDGYLIATDGITYMQYVRDRLTGAAKNIPVTTSERWGVLVGSAQAALRQAVDQYVFANIYPFWDGAKIANWRSCFLSDYNALKNVMPTGKDVVVGETGWPSGVEPVTAFHTDIPSLANEQRYIQEYTRWAIKNRISSYLFEMFDEPWKWTEGQNAADKDGVGDHWGLYDKNSKPKFNLYGATGPCSQLLLLN